MRKLASLAAAVLAVGAVHASSAWAAPVTISFTGAVSAGMDPGFADFFAPGDAITGSFVFHDEVPDSNGSATIGEYVGISNASFHIDTSLVPGGYSIDSSFGGAIEIFDGSPDYYQIGAGIDGPSLTSSGFGFDPADIVLALTDPTGAAVTGDSLFYPALGDFGDVAGRVDFFGTGDLISGPIASLDFDISELSFVPETESVPAPAELALFAAGLAGLGSARRRRA